MVPVQTRTARTSPARTRTAQASTVEIATEGGAALAELDGDGPAARFLLVLTHGAGGSAGAPDLLAVRDAARPLGGLVARVTQPYRVRGARAPGSPVRQDAAWAEVVATLRELAPGVARGQQVGRPGAASRTVGEHEQETHRRAGPVEFGQRDPACCVDLHGAGLHGVGLHGPIVPPYRDDQRQGLA